MTGELHIGEKGTPFIITCKDQNSKVIPLDGATEILLVIKRPDDSRIERVIQVYTDGKDGKVIYHWQEGDLPIEGTIEGPYCHQVWASWGPDVLRHSTVVPFVVKGNI